MRWIEVHNRRRQFNAWKKQILLNVTVRKYIPSNQNFIKVRFSQTFLKLKREEIQFTSADTVNEVLKRKHGRFNFRQKNRVHKNVLDSVLFDMTRTE